MFSFVVLYLDHTRVVLHDQYFKLLWATLPLTHLFSGPKISDLWTSQWVGLSLSDIIQIQL